MVFQMVFLGCLQLYTIFITFFFFFFLFDFHVLEHEEVPVKLKPTMDYPLDRAACLFPRFQ